MKEHMTKEINEYFPPPPKLELSIHGLGGDESPANGNLFSIHIKY